jgi:hypothetical protein
MTRFTKTSNGKYAVKGHTYEMLIGTRAQVWHGTAHKTSGGLTKQHLMQNKAGRIVSRSKHSTAKKEMRLVKAGYGTKKGKFGFVKLSGKSKKMRGGHSSNSSSSHHYHPYHHHNSSSSSSYKKGGAAAARLAVANNYAAGTYGRRGGSRRNKKGGMVNLPLSPSHYDGKGVGTSGVQVQFIAGQGN